MTQELEEIFRTRGQSAEDITDIMKGIDSFIADLYAPKPTFTGYDFEPIMLSSPEEAYDWGQEYGFEVTIEEGWSILIEPSPDKMSVTSTLFDPEGWQITDEGIYTSPEGEQYTEEEIKRIQAEQEQEIQEAQEITDLLERIHQEMIIHTPMLVKFEGEYINIQHPDAMQILVEHFPDVFSKLLRKLGHTPDTEELLKFFGYDDTDISKFFGERYAWTIPEQIPFIGGEKWPGWLQTIVGGERGEGGILGAIQEIDYAFTIPIAVNLAKLAPNRPMNRELLDAYERFERTSIGERDPLKIYSKEMKAAYENWGKDTTLGPWKTVMSFLNPAWWIFPTSIGMRAGLLPLTMKGGLISLPAKIARVTLLPIAGVERAVGIGLKWTIGFPIKYAVVKPIQIVVRKAFEINVDVVLERWLVSHGLRGRTATRTVEGFLKKDYPQLKKVAQKNINKYQAEGGSLNDVTLKAAQDTIKDMEPALIRASKEAASPPIAVKTETELRTLAQTKGYTIVKIDPKGKLATTKGYTYRIQGMGDKVYARNLEEATNFIQTGSLTGLAPGPKATRLAELTMKDSLELGEKFEIRNLIREVGPREYDVALRNLMLKAKPEMPVGTVESAARIETRAEATTQIKREFFDAIPESQLDVSSTAYLRKMDFDEFVRLMPDVEETKLAALTAEVRTNVNEIVALQSVARNEIAGLEMSLRAVRPKTREAIVIRQQIRRLKNDIGFFENLSRKVATEPLTIEEAVSLGIALRLTKGGKLIPAIRKSGFSVTDEFARYTHFDDVKTVAGTWMDPTRMMQAIDGGYFNGALQKYVLHPTRRTFLASLGFSDLNKYLYRQVVEKYGMVGQKNLRRLSGDVIEQIGREEVGASLTTLLAKPSIAKLVSRYSVVNQRRIVAFARETRKFFDALIAKQNAVRTKRAQDLIPYRKNYRPWVAETNIWSRTFGLKRSPADIIEKPPLPDYINPTKPFNPREMAREGGLRGYELQKDLQKLVFDYIDTAGKDIFNTNIIHNAKIHAVALRSMGFPNSASLIEAWATECYAGVLPRISRGIRTVVPMKALRGGFFVRRQLTRAVFPLNWTWNAFVQTSSGAITIMRYGPVNTLYGLQYLFRPSVKLAVRDNAYSWIIKSRRGGKVAYQDIGAGLERTLSLEGGVMEKAEHYANFLTNTIEEKLTGISIWAAHRDGRNLGLRGRALWEYASEGGAKTQSMYNMQDLPGVLRAREVGTIAPFQTFCFEVLNTVRELNIIGLRRIIGKAGAYETISATSALGKATIHKRVKMLLEWMATIVVINAVVDKAINRKPWRVSSFIPFYSNMVAGTDPSNPWNWPLPLQYVSELWKGITAVIQYDDWNKLRKWVVRYHMLGGTQINRMIEGTIAVVHGEVRDVRGKTLFEIDPEEWWKVVLMGPYASEEGRAYIDELQQSRGTFYEFTGISLPEMVNVSDELEKGEGLLGGMDEEQNIYTIQNLRRLITTLESKVGRSRVEGDATVLAKMFLEAREDWEEYYETPSGQERLDYRMDNPEVEASLFFWGEISTLRNPESLAIIDAWMSMYGLPEEALPALANINAEVLRINWEWREQDREYQDLESGDARTQYLVDNPEYHEVRRQRDALEIGVPEELIKDYIGYYTLPQAGYENERFLMEHEEFYRYWVDELDHKEIDFSRIPTRDVEKWLDQYWEQEKGDARLKWRYEHPELETFMVDVMGYTPLGDRWTPPEATGPTPTPIPSEDYTITPPPPTESYITEPHPEPEPKPIPTWYENMKGWTEEQIKERQYAILNVAKNKGWLDCGRFPDDKLYDMCYKCLLGQLKPDMYDAISHGVTTEDGRYQIDIIFAVRSRALKISEGKTNYMTRAEYAKFDESINRFVKWIEDNTEFKVNVEITNDIGKAWEMDADWIFISSERGGGGNTYPTWTGEEHKAVCVVPYGLWEPFAGFETHYEQVLAHEWKNGLVGMLNDVYGYNLINTYGP